MFSFDNKGKYFGQKPLFFPPPLYENKLGSSLFFRKLYEFVILTLTIVNDKKMGENRPNRSKKGKIFIYYFFVFRLNFSLFFKRLRDRAISMAIRDR